MVDDNSKLWEVIDRIMGAVPVGNKNKLPKEIYKRTAALVNYILNVWFAGKIKR